jgi:hypothetical protein
MEETLRSIAVITGFANRVIRFVYVTLRRTGGEAVRLRALLKLYIIHLNET